MPAFDATVQSTITTTNGKPYMSALKSTITAAHNTTLYPTNATTN